MTETRCAGCGDGRSGKGGADAWGKKHNEMQYTEAEADDAIAASYLRDVTMVANDDRRMYQFALREAARAKSVGYRTETDRAEAVGDAVKGAFYKLLSPAQQEDPTGRLFSRFLAHVSAADLGFYYLNAEKERWSDGKG